MPRKYRDLAGQRFGRLVVTPRIVTKENGRANVCICDCGAETTSKPAALLSGHKRSCGCLAVDGIRARSTRHGYSANNRENMTPEYKTWMSMKARCADTALHRYGGRGIAVSDEWASDFLAFLSDMGPRPSPFHTLERVNNDGLYCKDNCEWTTKKRQARNRHTNLIVEYAGRSMSLAEACEITGVNYDAAKHRVHVGRPFNVPVRRNARDYRG